MELIVINENKLKVLLNKKDMTEIGLDENEFYCSVTNTREILKKILHNSPIATGFEHISSDDKILIQLYPEKNGGCELFVTKITLNDTEEVLFMSEENEEKYLLPKPIIKKTTSKPPLISYRFDKLEHSICAAKELLIRGICPESAFYQNDDGKYFLFINTKGQNADARLQTEFLSEFGEITNAENSYLMLNEYGKCIFKHDAIETLTKI